MGRTRSDRRLVSCCLAGIETIRRCDLVREYIICACAPSIRGLSKKRKRKMRIKIPYENIEKNASKHAVTCHPSSVILHARKTNARGPLQAQEMSQHIMIIQSQNILPSIFPNLASSSQCYNYFTSAWSSLQGHLMRITSKQWPSYYKHHRWQKNYFYIQYNIIDKFHHLFTLRFDASCLEIKEWYYMLIALNVETC